MDEKKFKVTPSRFPPGGSAELWGLAFPIILATLSQTLMSLVDTFFMSRIGTVEQGAVGFAAILFWTISSLFVGTQQGVSTFAAQHYGAGDPVQCGRDGWLGLYLALPSALILGGVAFLTVPIYELIGSDASIIPHASSYLRIRLIFSLFVLINYAVISFLRGIGDTKTPMIFTLAANLLNALLNYPLILGHWGCPRMGAEGAALGSGIATALVSVAYLVFFLSGERHRKFKTRIFKIASLKEGLAFLKVGGPIGGSWALEMISWAVFMGIVSRIGNVALTATVITFEVLHFSFMTAVSLGTAATTLVGQYLGAEKVTIAVASARSTIRSGVIYCLAMGLFFLLGRGLIMSVFTLDPQVYETGCRLFLYAALFQLFDGLGISANGVIRGAGDTRWPMIFTAVLAWGVFLPLVYFLVTYWGLGIDGAWIAATVFLAAMGIGIWLRYKGGKWKSMRV